MHNSPPPRKACFAARVRRVNVKSALVVDRRSHAAKAAFIIDTLDSQAANNEVSLNLFEQFAADPTLADNPEAGSDPELSSPDESDDDSPVDPTA